MRLYLVRSVLSIILLLGALAGPGCWRSTEPRPELTLRRLAAGERVRVVAFGDSVTRGYGVNHPWPELLEQQLRTGFPQSRVEVLNAGVDGHTAADGLSRLARDVLRRQPDLVLVAFGLNDLKLRREVAEFRADLARQVERIAATGSEVALLTTNPVRAGLYGRFLSGYNEAIRSLARERQIPLVDVAVAWEQALETESSASLLQDVAHPTERGHQVTAAAVVQLFRDF